jgi:hypothetical protein
MSRRTVTPTITRTPDGIAAAVNRLARTPDEVAARELIPVMDAVFAEYEDILDDRDAKLWARLARAFGAKLQPLAHELMSVDDLREIAVEAIDGDPAGPETFDPGDDRDEEYYEDDEDDEDDY